MLLQFETRMSTSTGESRSVEIPKHGGAASPGNGGADGSGCPSPLSWRDVLREFREQSERWTIRVADRVLTGRTIGSGPALYLRHGLLGSCESLALLVWLLRDRFRCVLYEDDWLDPHGRVRYRTADELADDLLAVADHHGDERMALFATGSGCVSVLGAALRYPRRIESLILQGGFARRRLSMFERLAMSAGRRLRGVLGQWRLVRELLQVTHRRWFPPFDPTRWDFFLGDAGSVPVRVMAARAQTVARFDVRGRLSGVTVPVLSVRTEGEGVVLGRLQQQLESELPQVRTVWLCTTGQIPAVTHPHRMARLIGSWLAGDEEVLASFDSEPPPPERTGGCGGSTAPPAHAGSASASGSPRRTVNS